MSKPRAYHPARWMGKLIFELKIFLFRRQFKLIKAAEKNLIRFVLFIVTLYVPTWYEASLCNPCSGPGPDLLPLTRVLQGQRNRKEGIEGVWAPSQVHLRGIGVTRSVRPEDHVGGQEADRGCL